METKGFFWYSIIITLAFVRRIKQFEAAVASCFTNHNIYIATDPTPVYVDHEEHAFGPTIFTELFMTIYT